VGDSPSSENRQGAKCESRSLDVDNVLPKPRASPAAKATAIAVAARSLPEAENEDEQNGESSQRFRLRDMASQASKTATKFSNHISRLKAARLKKETEEDWESAVVEPPDNWMEDNYWAECFDHFAKKFVARAVVASAALSIELIRLALTGGLVAVELVSAAATGDGFLFKDLDDAGEELGITAITVGFISSAMAAALLQVSGMRPVTLLGQGYEASRFIFKAFAFFCHNLAH
jgi:hypothetical protein